MIRKRLRKIIQQLLSIFCILKKKKCAQLISQKLIRIVNKETVILIIPNEEKEGWHYLAVKTSSPFLHRITLKYKGNFYCLNCLHSFRIENKSKSHGKVCNKNFFCGIVIPSKKDKRSKIFY